MIAIKSCDRTESCDHTESRDRNESHDHFKVNTDVACTLNYFVKCKLYKYALHFSCKNMKNMHIMVLISKS